MRTRILRAALVVLSTTSAVILFAAGGPAHAAVTSMTVDVLGDLGGFKVCVSGTATIRGDWQLDIQGVRSNGSRIEDSTVGLNITAYSICRPVYKLGTSYGEFAVTFTYTRGLADEVEAQYGGGAWAPGLNEDVRVGSGQ